MTLAEAAAVLGVHVDDPSEVIERAFRARARECHPDLVREGAATTRAAAAEFVRVSAAHEVLTRYAGAETAAQADADGVPRVRVTPDADPAAGSRVFAHTASDRSDPDELRWLPTTAWSIILVLAVALSFTGGPLPYSAPDLFIRLLPLAIVSVAHAITGHRALLALVLVFAGASVVVTVTLASFGSLVSLEVLLVPVIALVIAGRHRRAVARFRRRRMPPEARPVAQHQPPPVT